MQDEALGGGATISIINIVIILSRAITIIIILIIMLCTEGLALNCGEAELLGSSVRLKLRGLDPRER